MADFIYPLTTFVLDFICFILCVKLASSQRRYIWLIPTGLSLLLMMGSFVCLLATVSNSTTQVISSVFSYASIFLFLLTIIWFLTIIVFMKRTKPNRVIAEDQKALNEASYIKRRTSGKTRPKVDRRPTAAHEIGKTNSVRIANKAIMEADDPYDVGEVPTVRPKRTATS